MTRKPDTRPGAVARVLFDKYTWRADPIGRFADSRLTRAIARELRKAEARGYERGLERGKKEGR